MRNFFNWLLGLVSPKPQRESEQGKKFNNVSVDGLSAEKNVLQSISRKTGASLSEIRKLLFDSDDYCWPCCYRPGDNQRYYDRETRNAMMCVCVDAFGQVMKKK